MSEILEIMKRRHSVRRYKDIPISEEHIRALGECIDEINRDADMSFQLVLNEREAFSSRLAHYGRFEGVSNYFALVGKRCDGFDERIGYYGEKLVMRCHELGLHTCWVALTYKKVPGAFSVERGEKFSVVISVGYGKNRGLPRPSKTPEEVSNVTADSPEWFVRGVEGALTAPTAMNQQRFYLRYNGDGTVSAKARLGFYTRMDLGIVKYHFELAAGKENFRWRA